MGHRNKYTRSLHQQAHATLQGMLSPGSSKAEGRRAGEMADHIYSYSTYHDYKRHVNAFCRWMGQEHPEVTSLTEARAYVRDYMEEREEAGYSAWTLSAENAALCKVMKIRAEDEERYTPPTRHRADITRSRGEAVRDDDFSEEANADLVDFCKAAGPRRGALERLTGDDLYSRDEALEALEGAREDGDSARVTAFETALEAFEDENLFVYYDHDKGGKSRLSPVIADEDIQQAIIDRFEATPAGERVWDSVPSHADIHSYRADYATRLYEDYARDPDELHRDTKIITLAGEVRSEMYACRGDRKGDRLDYIAAERVSIALGHHRVDTAVTNYIRK